MALFFAGVLSSAVALPVSSLSNTSLAVGAWRSDGQAWLSLRLQYSDWCSSSLAGWLYCW
jgi:hypothetical protein